MTRLLNYKPKLSPRTSFGNHSDISGTYVTNNNVGIYAIKIRNNVGLIISLAFTLNILAAKYRNGALGGVILPMPIFTPMIAANW